MAVLRSRAMRLRLAACFLLADLVYMAGAFAEGASNRGELGTGLLLPSVDEQASSAAGQPEAAVKKNYAYVTLWAQTRHSPRHFMRSQAKSSKESPQNTSEPDESSHPWQLLKLVAGLQNVSAKYPLVVITNSSMVTAKVSEYPDVVLGQFNAVNLTCQFKRRSKFLQDSQKLQVWGLAEYDKVLWVDADIAIQKNIDYLFDLLFDDRTIYSQRENWECARNSTRKRIQAGFMLFRPSTELRDNITTMVNSHKICPRGDQAAVNDYFFGIGKTYGWKWNPLPDSTIIHSHCGHQADVIHYAAS